ncbi:phosphodiesterase yfcE [Yersinia pestis 1522]|nr:phosphodiesterase yfcE [Yersinia pestis 1412]AKS78173.1 phosphodiesterase yfcE [Yersinia pestis 1413]AKS79989.1 phosphodiesterase yfcE [Yersinia pestis 1522]AKS87828.1 phosphodiesterase yfcE [Yersinia pestis 8787]AKS93582.1 phosphodiesterase yfcE [Yersinia pestis 3770]AKS99723.1 phosphodiesterase yfcE [Yersinia pestis 3067]KNC58844.1 phosphodiesterase yfcE [Yersinia pestis 1670]KNC62434.1 phosphodiesterase yfcE [Yersinia pestis 14735]
MKLMFASDLHGSLPATERVLAIFDHSGAQWLVLLGDLLNHGPRNALPEGYQPAAVAESLNAYKPAAVAESLNAYKDSIIAVRGNCDSEVDQMLLQFPHHGGLAADYYA